MSTQLVGILNLTPDSFSDGGTYDSIAAIETYVQECIAANVAALDIGAESTRPGATSLDAEEEWKRLHPVLSYVIPTLHAAGVEASVDTYHPDTAAKALELGVDWINDVSGFQSPAMLDIVKSSRCKLVCMHSLTIPADPNVTLREDADVMVELKNFACERMDRFAMADITLDRIIFDPGIGFNKTGAQSLEILRRIEELQKLPVPLLIGHSRKSFLNTFTDSPAADRDPLTLVTSAFLAGKCVEYLRVHNVKAHAEAFALLGALHAS